MIKNTIKNILLLFDDNLFRWIVKLAYPEYRRPRKGYCYNFEIIRRYFFMQKILRFNGSVLWPVDFKVKYWVINIFAKALCAIQAII